MSDKNHMPPCVGGYEVGDKTCNGDPKSSDEDNQAPCAFRDQCVAVIKIVEIKRRKDPEYELTKLFQIRRRKSDKQKVAIPKNPEGLNSAIGKTIAQYGIQDGRLTNRKGGPKTAAKPQEKPKASGAQKSEKLVSWFYEHLEKASGRKIHPVLGDAETGGLFLIDRMENSNYAACYSKGAKGRGRIAIVSALPNRRSGTLQVRIACDFHQFMKSASKQSLEKLEPTNFTGNDGAFKVRLLGLDKERTALAAELVAGAIEKGIISLPEVC